MSTLEHFRWLVEGDGYQIQRRYFEDVLGKCSANYKDPDNPNIIWEYWTDVDKGTVGPTPVKFRDYIKEETEKAYGEALHRFHEKLESQDSVKGKEGYLRTIDDDIQTLLNKIDDNDRFEEYDLVEESLWKLRAYVDRKAKANFVSLSEQSVKENPEKKYRSKPDQAELVKVVEELAKSEDGFWDKDKPKPTSIRDEIYNKSLENSGEYCIQSDKFGELQISVEVKARALQDRVKDALKTLGYKVD